MRGHGSQWFSHKMNNRHPLQLKKSKSWEPFGSYQLISTANPAHLPQNRPNFEVNGLDWQCCLAGSSKTVPRISIFSTVLGAEYSFYVKSIATYAPPKVYIIIHSWAVCKVRTHLKYVLPYSNQLSKVYYKWQFNPFESSNWGDPYHVAYIIFSWLSFFPFLGHEKWKSWNSNIRTSHTETYR